MWKRKELKTNAKRTLKGNYWSIVIAVILIAVIQGNAVNPISNVQSVIDTVEEMQKSPEELEAEVEEVIADTEGDGEETASDTDADVALADNARGQETSNTEIVDEFLDGVGMEDAAAKQWTNGILAEFADNAEGAGSILYGIMNTINQMAFHDRLSPALVIGIGVGISLFLLLFVENVLTIGYCRYLLETRVYTKTRVNRLLFGWNIKRVVKMARIMGRRLLFQFLWSLTIVGGIIKSYSYRMVPYIAAENPDISAKEAIALSQKMMRGNKWRAFVLDISFWPWILLNAVTFGFLDVFFLMPYQALTGAELYMALRGKAKEAALAGAEMLDDALLTGDVQAREYPVEQYRIKPAPTRQWAHSNYDRSYSISSLILIFFSFSFVGWVWEVSLHLFTDGIFVNRGVLLGPWLPIYGSGGVLVLVLLKKLRKKPAVTFLATMVICGIVEYFTSWFLETTRGLRWWDYSGYFCNLNGRICLEGLLVFAMGGCAAIYLIAPALDDLFCRIPKKQKEIVCGVLLALFIGDNVYSHFHPNTGKGITDYQGYKKTAKHGACAIREKFAARK